MTGCTAVNKGFQLFNYKLAVIHSLVAHFIARVTYLLYELYKNSIYLFLLKKRCTPTPPFLFLAQRFYLSTVFLVLASYTDMRRYLLAVIFPLILFWFVLCVFHSLPASMTNLFAYCVWARGLLSWGWFKRLLNINRNQYTKLVPFLFPLLSLFFLQCHLPCCIL